MFKTYVKRSYEENWICKDNNMYIRTIIDANTGIGKSYTCVLCFWCT